MARRTRRKFTAEFKAETVKLIRESDRSIGEISRELGLSETAVRRWLKQAEIDDGKGPAGALTTDEQAELRRLRRENRELQMEREILKKANGLLRQGKSVRFAFIDAEKASYPVRLMCRVLQVSRSGFYAWKRREPSKRAKEDDALRPKVRAIFEENRRTYGSPRIQAELAEDGHAVSKKRIARLMMEEGLQAVIPRRFRLTTNSDHDDPVAENLLDRQFDPAGPNQAWASDITYVWTGQGWLYLAIVMDLFSRRIVGWCVDDNMETPLVTRALDMAIGRRLPSLDLLHHSDRGSQYASGAYQELLEEHGIKCSMSRRGNCWDNAVVESFFGTLKTELIYRRPWPTRESAHQEIAKYIELFYNTRRRHSYLGHVSPATYEHQAEKALREAA
ncbi:MAG: IS3 family transposase [Dehalococcoidia bacterium]